MSPKDEQLEWEFEHEKKWGNQDYGDILNFIFPWFEQIKDYYDSNSLTVNDYDDSTSSYLFEITPDEEEFNDLIAEMIFNNKINNEDEYYKWQRLFNHDVYNTINKLKKLCKKV